MRVRFDRQSLHAMSYSGVGLELVLSIALGGFGGHWLDGQLGTAPLVTVLGVAFGVAAGVRAVYRAWQRMQRETENDGFRTTEIGRPTRFAINQRREDRK